MKNHDAFAVSGTSPTQKSDSPAAPSSNSPTAIESRIDPVRLARILRQRLETRHPRGSAVRRLLDVMTDAEIVAAYTAHHRTRVTMVDHDA